MPITTGTVLINPVSVLEKSEIKEGMQVADFGCGSTGHFVFPAAKLVGLDGRVYAVDIQKPVLQAVRGKADMFHVQNIETVWGDIERLNGVKIKNGALDLVLAVNNLSLVKEKSIMCKEMNRVLKSGGKLILIDWKTTNIPFGPPPASRISKDDARSVIEAAGFKFLNEFEAGPYHYGLNFEKP